MKNKIIFVISLCLFVLMGSLVSLAMPSAQEGGTEQVPPEEQVAPENQSGPEEQTASENQVFAGEAYTVQGDDWLSKLADKYYDDVLLWPVIYRGTNVKAAEDSSFTVLTNPNVLEIGWKLWIPPQDEAAALLAIHNALATATSIPVSTPDGTLALPDVTPTSVDTTSASNETPTDERGVSEDTTSNETSLTDDRTSESAGEDTQAEETEPTATSVPSTPTPMPPTPTPVLANNSSLAPEADQSRLYVFNELDEALTFTIDGREIQIPIGGLGNAIPIDLAPAQYTFTISIPFGSAEGKVDMGPDQSWAIGVRSDGAVYTPIQVYP